MQGIKEGTQGLKTDNRRFLHLKRTNRKNTAKTHPQFSLNQSRKTRSEWALEDFFKDH